MKRLALGALLLLAACGSNSKPESSPAPPVVATTTTAATTTTTADCMEPYVPVPPKTLPDKELPSAVQIQVPLC